MNEPITDDSVGNLTGNILAAIAQFENDEKARRTKAGMQAALAIGRWPFQAPLGYLNGGPNGRGALMPDASRAPLVRSAFELYGSRRHTKTEVLRKIILTFRSVASWPAVAARRPSLAAGPRAAQRDTPTTTAGSAAK